MFFLVSITKCSRGVCDWHRFVGPIGLDGGYLIKHVLRHPKHGLSHRVFALFFKCQDLKDQLEWNSLGWFHIENDAASCSNSGRDPWKWSTFIDWCNGKDQCQRSVSIALAGIQPYFSMSHGRCEIWRFQGIHCCICWNRKISLMIFSEDRHIRN